MPIVVKKRAYYAQEMLLLHSRNVSILNSKTNLLHCINIPSMLKKGVYYDQEKSCLCSKNAPIMFNKHAYYVQEMCIMLTKYMYAYFAQQMSL